MARDDDNERGGFTSSFTVIEGNLTSDPKQISGKGKATCVVLRVAVNSRDSRGNDGVLYYDVKVWDPFASNALESFSRGSRIIAAGNVEANVYRPNDEDEERTTPVILATFLGASLRWNTVEYGDSAADSRGGSSRRNRDEDDEDTRGSRRSRRDDDEDDEGTRGSRRRRRDDDEDEDERPARRRRRDDDDEDDSRSSRGSRRRSRVDDDGDDD